jgi:hypothetical protein
MILCPRPGCGRRVIPVYDGQRFHPECDPDPFTLEQWIAQHGESAFRRVLADRLDRRLAELEATQTWRAER